MRSSLTMAALILLLVVTAPVSAQRALSSYSANAPRDTVNRVVDMSNAVPPPPSISTSAQNKGFSLKNILNRIALPGIKKAPATSPLPPVASYPSTSYPNFFQPLPPGQQVVR